MAQLKKILSFLHVALMCVGCTILSPADLPPLIATNTPLPPTVTPLPTFTPTPIPERYTVEGFENFIAEVESTDRTQRQGLINKFMVGAPRIPLTTNAQAIFLWQGTPDQVDLIGDMNNWQADNPLPLTRLSNTDLWYRIEPYEPNARLDYKYLVDGENEILDPVNPAQVQSGFGRRSVLTMPDYVAPEELLPTLNEIPVGTLTSETIASQPLGQTRTLFIYTPAQPAQGGDGKYPSVYVHDGSDYLNFIDTTAILDRLIADGRLPPLVAVFLPPIDRRVEYLRNDAYVEFMANEAVPYIQANYNTSSNPADTGSLGASMGGLISVYAALNRPDVFGLVGSQSGALAYGGDGVIRQVELMPVADIRFYLTIGSYETQVAGTEAESDFVDANRRFAEQLRVKDYDFVHAVRPQGHSWGFWQATLGETLIWLYDGS